MKVNFTLPKKPVFGLSLIIILLYVASEPASAVEICNADSSAPDTIRDMFLILQVLGPVFGILFYTMLLVADAMSLESDRQEKRRKVILYGFSVPVAIVLLQQVANQLVDQNISCFFPT